MTQDDFNPKVVERLLRGDWSFGHDGNHYGIGTKNCPKELHHHHDEFCRMPSLAELAAAGIPPENFKAWKRR